MRRGLPSFRSRERGAVLIIGLIMLAVMTLLVISMLKTSVFELKIGGANQQAAVNLANAEMALNTYISSNAAFSLGCLTAAGPTACNAQLGVQMNMQGGSATVNATQVGCTPGGARGTGNQLGSLPTVLFDARATATGTLSGTSRVHMGIRAAAPAGTC